MSTATTWRVRAEAMKAVQAWIAKNRGRERVLAELLSVSITSVLRWKAGAWPSATQAARILEALR